MSQQCKQNHKNKLAVPQAQNAIENCKVEFADEFAPPEDQGVPNRLAGKCPKKKQQ